MKLCKKKGSQNNFEGLLEADIAIDFSFTSCSC